MKCHHCNKADLIETVAENYSYDECGLPNIVLKQIPVRLCPNCGMKYAGIPNMSGLHRETALELIKMPERLAPAEIAFYANHWVGPEPILQEKCTARRLKSRDGRMAGLR